MKTLAGLTQVIYDLASKPLTNGSGDPLMVKWVLATTLAQGRSSDPVRATRLATTIYGASETVDVEDADYELLREAVKSEQVLSNLAKAACLTVLDSVSSSDGVPGKGRVPQPETPKD